jgi:pimeloyl-ACP methyl ester carboxylesterase
MSTDPGSPIRPDQLWLTRDGVRLHGLDWGGPEGGPLVLLLHGVAGNALVWNEVAPILRASLPDHRIVALDTRDGGRSDHPGTGYALADFVADVLAVADALGAARISLVGHSRGGWLAACIAALHPDRVNRLVLVDPARISFGSDDAADDAYRRFAGGLGPFTSREEALAAARTEEPTALWTPTRVHALLDNLVDLPDGSVVSRLPGHVLDQLRAARGDGERVRLEGVRAPTLLLLAAGLGDQHMADRMVYAERIPGTRVERVMGTHFLHTDAPETVARLITGHLGA